MKLNYKTFKEKFVKLCVGLDIDHEKKIETCDAWYDTALANITEDEFNRIIKYSLENIEVKFNKLPTVNNLLKIYYDEIKERPTPGTIKNDDCNKCDGVGYIPFIKILHNREYSYVAHCDCRLGRKMKKSSEINKRPVKPAFYKDLHNDGVPF